MSGKRYSILLAVLAAFGLSSIPGLAVVIGLSVGGCGKAYVPPGGNEPHATVMILDVSADTTDLSMAVDGARVPLESSSTSLVGRILLFQTREYQVFVPTGTHDIKVGALGGEPGLGAMTVKTSTADSKVGFAAGQMLYLVATPTKSFGQKRIVAISAAEYSRCRRLTEVDWSKEIASRDPDRLTRRVGECPAVQAGFAGTP